MDNILTEWLLIFFLGSCFVYVALWIADLLVDKENDNE